MQQSRGGCAGISPFRGFRAVDLVCASIFGRVVERGVDHLAQATIALDGA